MVKTMEIMRKIKKKHGKTRGFHEISLENLAKVRSNTWFYRKNDASEVTFTEKTLGKRRISNKS